MDFITAEQRTARRLAQHQVAALRGRRNSLAFHPATHEERDALWEMELLLGDLIVFIETGRMGTQHTLHPF